MESAAFVATLVLMIPLVFMTAWTLFFVYTLNRNVAKHRLGVYDQTIDYVIADIKNLDGMLSSLKVAQADDRAAAAHRIDRLDHLVLTVFDILKNSIENDLTQEQALAIIKDLKLEEVDSGK